MSIILRVISGVLVSLVALVFTVLEGTLLFTLDFLLYENELVAFVQLMLKLLIAASALTVGVLSLVMRKRTFLLEGVCLTLSAASMIPFVSNNFGIYFTAVAVLFLLSHLISYRAELMEETADGEDTEPEK